MARNGAATVALGLPARTDGSAMDFTQGPFRVMASVAESFPMTYNFSSGPAALPAQVVEQIREDLPDWHGTGMPVMTLSHRGSDFVALMDQVKAKLRDALSIPDSHEVLILHGGGIGQFAAVPMNLSEPGDEIGFLITGHWGLTAAREAERMGCSVTRVGDEAASGYTTQPDPAGLRVPPTARYLHYVPNETIGGVELSYVPACPIPLVADASSQILSRPMDVGAHGVVFAGTQKNLGVAGAAVVIVNRELIGHARASTPSIWDYSLMAASDSLLNTPTTFAVYVLNLLLDWTAEQGGVQAMAAQSGEKAAMVYSTIDGTSFYHNPVASQCRSTKNIPFTLADPSLDAQFLAGAASAGLAFLAGHRSVGGMRASIYNAMPYEGVRSLVDFMTEFERRHG